MSEIKQRKKDHVELSLSDEVEYSTPTGFEQFQFIHNALPEVNFKDVTTEATFLGRTFSFPLFISSMTGGYTDAGSVNTIIAEFCEENHLPFGVGSQRIMLEDPETISTFSVVREKAPNAFIASNLGGAQLVGGLPEKQLRVLIDSIQADAVIVHLNPLQELMQPEGDRNFRGIEDGIAKMADDSPVPVIVKETGAGITGSVAKRLLDAGVAVVDIAGSGGTSWAKIENRRPSNKQPREIFDEWGTSTVQCLLDITELKQDQTFELIASGGIRSSYDIVKALCLGADFTASARPVIQSIMEDGYDGIQQLFDAWKYQVRVILTLLGCEQISDLGPQYLNKR